MFTPEEFIPVIPTLQKDFSATGNTCRLVNPNNSCYKCKYTVELSSGSICYIHYLNSDYIEFVHTNFPELLI